MNRQKRLKFRLESKQVMTINDDQSGLTVPYIPEPSRTVPCIIEPNRLPARNFRARAEPNRGSQCSRSTMYGSKIYEPNRIGCWNARYGTVRLGDVRLNKSDVRLCL